MDTSPPDLVTQSEWRSLNMESPGPSVVSKMLKCRKKKCGTSPRMSQVKRCQKRRWREMLSEPDCNVTHSECRRIKMSTDPGHTCKQEMSVLLSDSWEVDSGFSSEISPPTSGRSSPCVGIQPSDLVALDCEMVGTGPNGQCSELARCSLVNYYGTVIFDEYVRPCQPVTDYRTKWSGITIKHLQQALPYGKARKEILELLKGKVIIGHALKHDFTVLDISVPHGMVRDTSSMPLLQQMYGTPHMRISLKKLSEKLLNRRIQTGKEGHCSVEDARAALDLYKLVEVEWERSVQGFNRASTLTTKSTSSLEHYMEDQYWPDSLSDCNE